jgi:ornithine cyclodeaminase/alanine dehydrogenase
MPQRTPIKAEKHEGVALFMPAYMKKLGALGCKIVTVFKNNPSKYQLPTVLGIIALLDESTGKTLSIMDGGFITAMRTGAVSGVATKFMANPVSKVAAIIGSGVQAKAQVWATCTAVNFDKYYVYSIDAPDDIEKFCENEQSKHGIPFIRANSAEEALSNADVVTLATSAKDPVIRYEWLKKGCHINGIGSHSPAMREIDEDTVLNSRIIADYIPACLAEAGDFIIPINEGKMTKERFAGDLGGVICGNVAGRTNHDEITIFKSVGLAIQDVSTALAVYRLAFEKGVGSQFDFGA